MSDLSKKHFDAIYETNNSQTEDGMDIAVIGIGLKIAHANNLNDYWSIFENNMDCIREMPENRKEQVIAQIENFISCPDEPKLFKGSYLERLDEFDNEFFKLSPREASLMDPCQRLILETIYQTFDDAGYTDKLLKGSQTGIFIGYTAASFKDSYFANLVLDHPELAKYAMAGNIPAIIPSRISQLLDLHGPTMILDTACSSSMVSIHLACESLKSGTSSMAIAGGIKINYLPVISEILSIGTDSADGKTRTFDDGAEGTGIGEGIATVLLKPLEQAKQDNDNIYAVIKSTAINHDGTAAGITAPNPAAQTKVILDAWKRAKINPEHIDYIEVHGTGTVLGDPIEIQGITNAFRKFTNKSQICALSASKTNIGHLYECAGIAAFIKAVAALKNKKIPGMLNFLTPNTKTNFVSSPVYVNTRTKEWEASEDHLRTCGVSAFGLSGTNAHVILQEYVQTEQYPVYDLQSNLLCLSTKSIESMGYMINEYIEFVEALDEEQLVSACYSTMAYRTLYKYRLAIIFNSKDDLLNKLKQIKVTEEIMFDNSEVLFGVAKTNDQVTQQQMKSSLIACHQAIVKKDFNEYTHYLKVIGDLYINGSTIDVSILYEGMKIEKMHLPVYQFKKNRLWMPIKKTQVEKVKANLDKEYVYYQKHFVEATSISEQSSEEKGLFISFKSSNQSLLYEHLNKQFQDLQLLIIDEDIFKDEDTNKDYFSALFHTVDFTNIQHIVIPGYLYQDKTTSFDVFKKQQKTLLLTMLYLYQHLDQYKQNALRITYLMDFGFEISQKEKTLNPEKTTVYGFGKALNREYKKIHFIGLDVDDSLSMDELTAEILKVHKEDLVVYRHKKMYIEAIREVDKQSNASDEIVIKDQGVYLITGGLGGIGFEIAHCIANNYKDIKLIIFGRTELTSSQDPIMLEKRERLQKLQLVAGSVEYINCNIADMDNMQKVMDHIQDKYGILNGVIHAAGIGGGSSILEVSESRLLAVIEPKLFGNFVLDQLTSKMKLDFYVMFSSIATIFSSSDLTHYIAANMYLDAFSAYRIKRSGQKTLTVNWATWSETGMSVEHQFTVDTLFKAIKTKDGINRFFDVLNSSQNNIAIAELNLGSKIALLLKQYPIQLSPYIEGRLTQLKNNTQNESVDKKTKIETNNVSKDYQDVEIQIHNICCEILGYEEISIVDNFFELGADSILLNHIFKKVDERFPGILNVTDLFAHPTVQTLSEHIMNILKEKEVVNESINDKEETEIAQTKNLEEGQSQSSNSNKDIAIIGVGINLPNARTLEEYWEGLIGGVSSVKKIPNERRGDIEKHLRYMGMKKEDIQFKSCGYLDEINKFDYSVFGISPRDAALIDPANRLFMQCCYDAIEDSGYGTTGIRGSKTGVFLGYTANLGNAYSRLLYEVDKGLFNESLPINQVSMTASRIAYACDLKGPSMVIDTACSSSLVSIHMACEQIRLGKCDMALAGGVSITSAPLAQGFSVGFESVEDRTLAFAEDSSGAAIGEGAGVILLKSLDAAQADGDLVYAVIKGSAINQDGSSFGIAAPNYLAQSQVIQDAWKDANINPLDISYIEAHGTGTPLGDPIEVRGITHAFECFTKDHQVCGFGSVKTNLGHLNEASGISGLCKLILMLQHKEIPPSLYFNVPSMNIDFVESPLYMITRRTKLQAKSDKILLGMSGFGMSGTNCHIILEEAPKVQSKIKQVRDNYFITLSAKSKEALLRLCIKYIDFIEKNPNIDMGNLAYTVNTGRAHYSYRLGLNTKDLVTLKQQLISAKQAIENNMTLNNSYYGYYTIVPESKKERYSYEITQNEYNMLKNNAMHIVEAIDKNPTDLRLINQLLEAYVKGAEVNWKMLYHDNDYQRLHLPTYSFERSYCWYKIPGDYEEEEDLLLNSMYYEERWEQRDFEGEKVFEKDKAVVVFLDKSGQYHNFVEYLRKKGQRVIEVIYSETYMQKDEDTYEVSNNLEQLTELWMELGKCEIKRIIHMRGIINDLPEAYSSVTKRLDNGFFDLIANVKAISKAHFKGDLEMIIIADNAYGVLGNENKIIPESAANLSIGRVIEQEYPNISCRAIDIDDVLSEEVLADEIMHIEPLYLVAYRNQKRYVQIYDEADIKKEQDLFKENGTYIITGGTSGIGLEVAQYISSKVQCNLILVSRSGFVPKEEWCRVTEEEEVRKVEIFNNILGNGCRLEIMSCDIGEYDSVSQIINHIHNRYGKLDGIIHSAGISKAGYILRKEKDEYLEVMKPKVRGIWNLHELTKNENLDFMVIFSSGVTNSGEAGQSDYVAANTYLDAFTDYRNAQGKKTITINWSSWKETGMSVKFGVNKDMFTKAIDTVAGLEAFEEIVTGNKTRIVVNKYNVSKDFANVANYLRGCSSDRLRKKFDYIKEKFSKVESIERLEEDAKDYAQVKNGKIIFTPKTQNKSKSEVTKKVILTGDLSQKYTKTEQIIADIYGVILGYDEINVYNNFFEMGGDSVMLTNMHNRIVEVFTDVFTVADLFEYTSIRTLSTFIDETLNDNSDEPLEIEVEKVGLEKYLEIESEYYPMSSAQERIYYEHRISRNKLAYNIPFIALLKDIQMEELRAGLNKLVERNEILRTSFKVKDHQLSQVIEKNVEFEIDVIHIRDLSEVNLGDYITEFKLNKLPLFNVIVFENENNEKMLFIDMHHIIGDGLSSNNLRQQLFGIIKEQNLPEPKYQYRHFALYEKEYRRSQKYEMMKKYWAQRFNTYTYQQPIRCNLVDEGTVSSINSISIKINNEMGVALNQYGRKHGVTLFNIFLGSYYLVLSSYEGVKDLSVGVPVLCRGLSEVMDMLGVFVNILPIRMQLDNQICVSEYFKKLKENISADLTNQYVQYNDIISSVAENQSMASKQLFSVYFDFESEALNANMEDQKQHQDIEIIFDDRKYDIDMMIQKQLDGYSVKVVYEPHYSRELMEDLLERYLIVLNILINDQENLWTVGKCIEDISK